MQILVALTAQILVNGINTPYHIKLATQKIIDLLHF
jgi:hypothetical protein